MKRFLVPAFVTLTGIVAAIFATSQFPAVKGLGTKVRLPVYHGAMTWATFVAFALLLVCALWYVVTQKEIAWKWDTAFRWTVVIMWAVGSILGYIAAYDTWDLSAAQGSAFQILSEDPRMVIQLIIMCLGAILLCVPLVFEGKRIRAGIDVAFVVASAALLMWAMDAGRALHPDSPVLNSPEMFIKVMFFTIVAGHLVTVVGVATLFVSAQREKEK
jgi:hypothetical protein